MFKLIVTDNETNSVEQSDFETEIECENWKAHLESIGYNFTDTQDENGNVIRAIYSFAIEEYKAPIGSISPRQIRMALLAQGINESAIESAINGLPSPQKEQAMIAWKYSTEFVREQASVNEIGGLVGLSSEQLDALWLAAKAL